MTVSNVATPGPWRAKTQRIIVAQVPYIDDHGRERFYDKEIAWMQPIGSAVPGSREANARLIAAAPDFAEVAPDAADILDNYAGFIRHSVKADDLDMHPYLPHLEDVIAKLRAALTRSTGDA